MLRTRSMAAVVGAVVLVSSAAAAPQAGAAGSAQELEQAAPFYMKSKRIRARIDRAGAKGVSYARIQTWVRKGLAGKKNKDEPVPDPCPTLEPGTKPNSVHANACITYPAGCTANFIYHKGKSAFPEVSDGRNQFLGTAGHCVDHSGQPVYADNGSGAMIRVGEVWKHVDGGIGNDMAAVRIDQGHAMDPRMPGDAGGPMGVYDGCAPGQLLAWWGHGYGLAVGQGQDGNGLATNWWDRAYGWDGDALPGDSGSGVVIRTDKKAAGNLTHLVVGSAYLPAINAGTRMTHILAYLGGDVRLVNENRTLADAPRSTNCGNPNNGNG